MTAGVVREGGRSEAAIAGNAERIAEQMRNVVVLMTRAGHLHSEVVPGVGLEPTRLAAGDFESPASTDFAIRASSATRPRSDDAGAAARACN